MTDPKDITIRWRHPEPRRRAAAEAVWRLSQALGGRIRMRHAKVVRGGGEAAMELRDGDAGVLVTITWTEGVGYVVRRADGTSTKPDGNADRVANAIAAAWAVALPPEPSGRPAEVGAMLDALRRHTRGAVARSWSPEADDDGWTVAVSAGGRRIAAIWRPGAGWRLGGRTGLGAETAAQEVGRLLRQA